MAIRNARFLAVPLLMLGSIAAQAQYQGSYHHDHSRDDYYNGMRDGGRGGYYGRDRYDDRYRKPGGIGPGKGALIGGAGGAALGAIFGGGLKGTIIGGAAGAGIGAIAGKVHQNHKRDQYGYYPR